LAWRLLRFAPPPDPAKYRVPRRSPSFDSAPALRRLFTCTEKWELA